MGTSIRMLKIPKTTTTTLVLLILAAAYATAQSPPLRPPIPPCMPEFSVMENKAASAQGARRVAVGDIDGDGTVDLVSASSGDHTIAWYPNIDGEGTFSSVTSVTTTAVGAWEDAYPTDLVRCKICDDSHKLPTVINRRTLNPYHTREYHQRGPYGASLESAGRILFIDIVYVTIDTSSHEKVTKTHAGTQS